MANTDSSKKTSYPMMRLVTIASGDNPQLLLSALTYPQTSGGQVSFDKVRTETKLQPFSWWVLHPVTADRTVFQILFHPSDGQLCLAASAATANSNLQLSKIDPTNQLQLWILDETKSGGQLITCHGATDKQFGFPHDIPLKEMALQLTQAPDSHETGDKFQIKDVVIEAP